MLRILRFLRGYIIISFCGENAEKILNVCAKAHLNIWGMIYKNGTITAKMDIKSFKKLKKQKHGIKANVKIIKKRGLPFIIKRYNKRLGLLTGIIVFFSVIQFLSCYIWSVSVNGCVNLKCDEIVSECALLGIKEGVKKNIIDPKNDAQKLLLKDGRIAWASINIEGCYLTVNISESSTEKGEKNQPSNLKAKRDGIITGITAASGNVVVKRGDTVAKGDVLISGITEHLSSNIFTRAIGTVTAKTVRNYSANMNFCEPENIPVGKTKSAAFIKLFNIEIPLYTGSVKDITVINKEKNDLKIFGKKMPVSVCSLKYRKNTKKDVKRSREDIIKMLKFELDEKVKSENLISAILTDEKITETEKGIKIERTYTCEEIISYEDKIFINQVN